VHTTFSHENQHLKGNAHPIASARAAILEARADDSAVKAGDGESRSWVLTLFDQAKKKSREPIAQIFSRRVLLQKRTPLLDEGILLLQCSEMSGRERKNLVVRIFFLCALFSDCFSADLDSNSEVLTNPKYLSSRLLFLPRWA
jgi:hypothetical protein